jgi:hypothetical protein
VDLNSTRLIEKACTLFSFKCLYDFRVNITYDFLNYFFKLYRYGSESELFYSDADPAKNFGFSRIRIHKTLVITSVSDPDPHGSAFNWSPGSGSRRVKKS